MSSSRTPELKALIFGVLAVVSLLAVGLLSGCATTNIYSSSIPEIQGALDQGVSINTRESDPNNTLVCYDKSKKVRDFTPLIRAAMQEPGVVPFLIEHGADVNLTDGCDNTALHYAVYSWTNNGVMMKTGCAADECRLLLEHGADPRHRPAGGPSDFYMLGQLLQKHPDPALLAALTKAMGGEAALRSAMAAEAAERAPASGGTPAAPAPAAGGAKPWWE